MTEQVQLDAATDPNLLADELSQSLRSGFRHSGEYDCVNMLLVHWEDDDLGCLEEMNAVKSFFEDSLHYDVHILPIPSERSQAALQSDLSRFVLLYGSTIQSLLVIYYAGHGDPSLDQKRAIWAAKRKGGPTLNWYEVQPVVFAAEGDVLLVLDCCYAAQAARGRESRTIELLAASGVKQRTPQPGYYSFTTVLMRVMKRMLQETGQIVVLKLYERLFRETAPDEELVEQPFHFFIAEGGGSIVLKPRAKHTALDRTQYALPSALLSLTVSLSQKPDRSTMRRLGTWLKSAVPRMISSVDVERILLRTETIQEFLLARRDSALRTAIESDFSQSEQNERAELVSPSFSRARTPLQGSRNGAEDVLIALKEWNDRIYQSMERHLLLDPVFASHKSLTQLERNESAQVLGLDKAARLRMLNMEDVSEPESYDLLPLPYGAVKIEPAATGPHSTTTDEVNKGVTIGILENDQVWVDIFPYESQSDQGRVSAKVKRLATLFVHARSPAFLLAPFLGYIHEPLKNRFGLVFLASRKLGPSMISQYLNLQDAISQRRLMPLNRRMGLAFALSRAMSALHAVGWVHKSFCSENIVFIRRSEDTSSGAIDAEKAEGQIFPLDLDDPHLFGFESARPTNAISSETREFRLSRLLYTHPERWGRPGVSFGALHDIYALGVMLLEIGCWKQASRMDRRGRGFSDRRNENEVRDELLAVAREQLSHLTGESYSQAVIACLDGSLADGLEEGSEGLDLHQAFGRRVLIPLGRCTYAQWCRREREDLIFQVSRRVIESSSDRPNPESQSLGSSVRHRDWATSAYTIVSNDRKEYHALVFRKPPSASSRLWRSCNHPGSKGIAGFLSLDTVIGFCLLSAAIVTFISMDSLWKSFNTPVKSGHSGSDRAATNRLTSSLQQLLIVLANSQLANLSTGNWLHSTTGTYLGRGATYAVERRETTREKVVAIKHIRQDEDKRFPDSSESGISRHRLQSVLLEVQVLLHPFLRRQRNIIRLLAHGWDEEILPFLVTEFADLGTASRYLQNGERAWNDMARLIVDVASGLVVLHDCGIVHGDVKLENVLMFSEAGGGSVAKLSDFGFCGVEILGEYQYRGTRLLNAPEIRHPEDLHAVHTGLAFMKCDIYSFGLLAWETFNNGHRFYTSNNIGIASDEHERAEKFLSTLERAGSNLASYAEDFVRNSDSSLFTKEYLIEVITSTLKRDPSSRPQMVEVRRKVEDMINANLEPDSQVTSHKLLHPDPRSMSDSDVPNSARNLGLDSPLFVFFDIGLAQLPWSSRRRLVEGFIEGANDAQNSFASQDCFHIAACYASGYGFEINEAESLAYLTRAAKLGYKPAIVLKKCFEASGLLKCGLISQENNPESPLEKFDNGAASISPAALPSYLVRKYYIQQQDSDQVKGYYLEDQWYSLTNPQSLSDRLLNTGLEEIGKLYVEVSRSGEVRAVPAIHFLISHRPDIAQSVLARGFNGLSTDDSQISILNTACALGLAALAKDVLQHFPDLAFIPSKDGTTPLHWLFMFEPKDMIGIGELLVACGARLSATAVRDLPEFNLVLSGPPLHWAIMVRNEPAVRTLLVLGASMENNAPYPSHYKMYPWHALSLATCLFMPEIVQILLDAGAPLDGEGSEEGLTALHSLADACDPFRLWFYHGPNVERAAKETVGTLLKAGANLNISTHVTPLEWTTSVTTGLTWATKALLAYKPSIKLSNGDDNKSIMTTAATSLRFDQVNGEKMRLLLEYTSSKLPQDRFVSQCISGLEECAKYGINGAIREIFRHVLPFSKNVIDEEELLHLAAEDDHVDMIELLLKFGASIDHDDGGTAAACAAFHCSRKSLRLLLENGSTVLSVPTDGSTATLLHEIVHGYAPAQETFKTLSMLHENFRGRFLPVVNNLDNRGRTALHSAIICGKLQNIALLLEGFGADPTIPIRGTSISPTTLAMLARTHPSAYVRMFGDESRKQYDVDMAAVLEYLTGTWRLPAPDYSITEHWVTTLWERENYFPERQDDFDWTYTEILPT